MKVFNDVVENDIIFRRDEGFTKYEALKVVKIKEALNGSRHIWVQDEGNNWDMLCIKEHIKDLCFVSFDRAVSTYTYFSCKKAVAEDINNKINVLQKTLDLYKNA